MNPFHGREPGDLPELDPVLDRFVHLMMRADWHESGPDAPWWYNERATVSQFAGAVWTSGGWAFEEYAVDVAEASGPQDVPGSSYVQRGRCDLMIEVGTFKAIVEAKQVWARTPQQAVSFAKQAQQDAREQVTAYPDVRGAYRRLTLVFVVPRLLRAPTDDEIHALLQALASVSSCRAWAFPDESRALTSPRTRSVYPGIVALLAC